MNTREIILIALVFAILARELLQLRGKKPKALEIPKTKIIPVMQVGERSQAVAYSVGHDRCGCGVGQSSLGGDGAAQLSALVVGQGRKTGARSLKMLATPRLGAVWGGTTLFFPQNAPISAHFSYPWRIVAVPIFVAFTNFSHAYLNFVW